MGRHGGGSRSGGVSFHSSSGRHSSGTNTTKTTSSVSFAGSYNRSYINRRGTKINHYTTDKEFGTKKGWNEETKPIFWVLFISMLLLSCCFYSYFTTPNNSGKVNGPINRIDIVDNEDILTQEEETKLLTLFKNVYDKSGMPITLYTDDFSWKNKYFGTNELTPIQEYSEDLYYDLGSTEDSMVILFTSETINDFEDWEYDFYCGNDTIKCLSDNSFDKLINTFHKSLASKNLCDSLIYSWEKILPELGEQKQDTSLLFIVPFLVIFYLVSFIALFMDIKQTNEAYEYFQKNPSLLLDAKKSIQKKKKNKNKK